MKVITEMDLRDLYRKEPFEVYTLVHPARLTPAAFQFLTERRIRIIEEKQGVSGTNREGGIQAETKNKLSPVMMKEPEKGYLLMDSGKVVEEKPESHTHLKGRKLVPKNHKRIKFRGKLDILEANFINVIVDSQMSGLKELTENLTKIFEFTKKIMRAEVLDEPLEFIDFKGWSDADIREYSHYPDKYFGVSHFTPDPKFGKLMANINILRSMVRELEVTAIDAFYNEDSKTVEREDIILALNRLSSLIYIIMCQYIGGTYKLGQ